MKLQIQEVPNEEILLFHLDQKVSKTLMIGIDTVEQAKREGASKKLCLLAKSLLAISGIEELTFDKHEISVQKGRLFLWKKIEPKILQVIKSIFSPNKEIEKLPRKICTEEDRIRNQAEIAAYSSQYM